MPIWEERKLGVEVVTVVTALILLNFFCHHFLREVVTDPGLQPTVSVGHG